MFLNSVSISGIAGNGGLGSGHPQPATDDIVVGAVGQEGTGFSAGAIVQVVVTISDATSYTIATGHAFTIVSATPSPFSSSSASFSGIYTYTFDVTFGSQDFWLSITGNGFGNNTDMAFGISIDSVGYDANSADWNSYTTPTPSSSGGRSGGTTLPTPPLLPPTYSYHTVSNAVRDITIAIKLSNGLNPTVTVSGTTYTSQLTTPGSQVVSFSFPGQNDTAATAVNNKGQVVGSYVTPAQPIRPTAAS